MYFSFRGEHPLKTVSSFPFPKETNYAFTGSKGDIQIDDDVWICQNTIILSGVHIGQGAVIGAGSVVRNDVPPYAIFVGNQVVKYRFPDSIIKKLLTIDYEKISRCELEKYKGVFSLDVDEDNIDEIVSQLTNVKEV